MPSRGRKRSDLSESREFAVVLMDVQMPGWTASRRTSLLRSGRSSLVPIIFITALDRDVTHARRGYERGAVDYLFKPVEPEILRAKVAVFVELHRQREALRVQAEQLQAERVARVEAEAAIRAREDILSIVSHDIGNPITAVGTYAALLRKHGTRWETRRSSLMPSIN